MRVLTLPDRYIRVFLRSIRLRITLLITVLLVLFIVPAYLRVEALTRQTQDDSAWRDVERQATLTAAAVRAGPARILIRPDIPGVDLIQVVGPDHRVIMSTPAARGLTPLSDVWPSLLTPERDLQASTPQGRLYLSAVRLSSSLNSAVVYAARRAPDATSARRLWLLLLEAVLFITLAACFTWRIADRLLSPVGCIRATLCSINSNNLSSRVPVPPGNDEIVRLARTINGTLDRLEKANECSNLALARLSRFTSDASHELRTPLAGLRVLLEEAQLHPCDTELPQLLDEALSDVDRLQTIICDLLLLSGLEAGIPADRDVVDLSQLVKEEVGQRKDLVPVLLRLETGTTVRVCRIQMARVLTNLLDNAQRHAKHVVQVEVHRRDAMAELTVSDDGAGIPMADRDRVFERFTRLDAARCRDRGGSGLGLAIARDIAHAHRGTLTAGCSPLGGARFVLCIPFTVSAPSAIAG
ncbi:HAMP domain-containing sensor histidine kinase [Microbispora rosea]|uniref:HAMP domain-containing sensor histidine kinase n=1 Tax=Microbispora rosea TaxID=58117 RepID=UPI00343EEE34